MKKRFLALLLGAALALSCLAGCGASQTTATPTEAAPVQTALPETTPPETAPATQEFTDSTGRTVTLPANITRIAITGPLTQIYMIPLAGDLLVGVSNTFSLDAEKYLPEYIFQLDELGQLYGGKGEMDLEALLAAAPEVVIDVGEAKGSMAGDLQGLTDQTGIHFIHIDATVATTPEAYRTLGKLLGRGEKGEELASYCEGVLAQTQALMDKVDAQGARKTMLYCLGDGGVNVLAQGSFHAETVNTLADNVAVVEDVVSKGSGNEVDLEQILLWDPDVIVFAPDSIYDQVGTMEAWQSVRAIASGQYYKTPYGPYGWLSSPPSVQRYLGLLWLSELLYPEDVSFDLQEAVTEYYRIFYGCELTEELYQDLVKDALPETK